MKVEFHAFALRLAEGFPKGSIWQTRYLCFPTALVLSTLALSKSHLPLYITFFWFSFGVLTWTFLEYILHRWLLHYVPKTTLGKTMLRRLHLDHHEDPKDESIVCVPFVMVVPLWGLLFLALLLFGGGYEASFLFVCGVALMMVIYDITHFSTHYMKATNKFLKMLKKNHMYHHFKDHDKRYGVTSPIWDFVFRTY